MKTRWYACGCRWGVLLLALLALGSQAEAADIHLDVLKSGTSVFSNVTVYAQTDTDIFIRHSQGFGNVKISNLDLPTLRQLGLAKDEPGDTSADGAVAKTTSKLNVGSLSGLKNSVEANALKLSSTLRPTPALLASVLAGFLLLYLLYCYCLKLICAKAGSEPGFLIWLPGLQTLPLLRAAGMSGWWFLASFVPLLNVIGYLLWCVKIVHKRGKGMFTVLLLILPVTNILALLYLAFSGGDAEADNAFPKAKHESVSTRHVFEGLPN